MMSQSDTQMSVSTRGIIDLIMLALPAAAAGLQFIKNERSYEVLALALAFIFLYLYLRLMLTQIESLKAQVRELVQQLQDEALRHKQEMAALMDKHQDEVNRLNSKHDAYAQAANTSTANLFSELSAHAGSRIIGSLDVHPSGAMVYLKPSPAFPPDGIERRGAVVDKKV